MNKIPFVDLKAQYHTINSEIDIAMQLVMEQTAYIGGNNPFVQHFENSFSNFLA